MSSQLDVRACAGCFSKGGLSPTLQTRSFRYPLDWRTADAFVDRRSPNAPGRGMDGCLFCHFCLTRTSRHRLRAGPGTQAGEGSKRFQLFDGDAIATNLSDFARLPYGSAPTASWDAASRHEHCRLNHLAQRGNPNLTDATNAPRGDTQLRSFSESSISLM